MSTSIFINPVNAIHQALALAVLLGLPLLGLLGGDESGYGSSSGGYSAPSTGGYGSSFRRKRDGGTGMWGVSDSAVMQKQLQMELLIDTISKSDDMGCIRRMVCDIYTHPTSDVPYRESGLALRGIMDVLLAGNSRSVPVQKFKQAAFLGYRYQSSDKCANVYHRCKLSGAEIVNNMKDQQFSLEPKQVDLSA